MINTYFPTIRIIILRIYYNIFRYLLLGIARIIHKFPISSELFGPPKRAVLSTPIFLKNNNTDIGQIIYDISNICDTDLLDNVNSQCYNNMYPFYIAILNNARICLDKGVVISSSDDAANTKKKP
ncbi:hypothetical protein A946_11715 [Methylacidiphilum kamchatkense Kam1]|uniref:Uncharacterized protein n=1 Tax=Methylacidiphilum kamchatkense Kam1 TaxID=1202785 RepID=A0ABR4ZTZ3_9BACT|nr:hypothetical protein A946_11715 [Methylacidiphilum kamchatkense Kam1]